MKGNFYKVIGALVEVKGAFSYVKRGTFWILEKWGHCAPYPPLLGSAASDCFFETFRNEPAFPTLQKKSE